MTHSSPPIIVLVLIAPPHFGGQDARIAKELHLEHERERKGENSSNVADDDIPEPKMAVGEPSLWMVDGYESFKPSIPLELQLHLYSPVGLDGSIFL